MTIPILYEDKHPTLDFSALELQKYLSKITSPDQDMFDNALSFMNITFRVKDNLEEYDLPLVESPDLDDQFYFTIDQSGGLFIGTNHRSILLGVYKYLYLIGYRFLRPGEEYVYYPAITTIEDLYISHKETASIRHRGVCIEGANSLENITDFIDWLPKIGMNSFFVQFKIPYTFMEMWYHHKFNKTLEDQPFDMETAELYSKKIDDTMELREILHHRVGHGWTGDVLGHSSIGWAKTDKKLTSFQQSITAMINGERVLFDGIPTNTNLCYSNPEVLDHLAIEITKYATAHKNIDFLHIWLADEHNNFCECNDCRELSPTDHYINLLNKIDEYLTKADLPVKLVFLLYHELLWAPVTKNLHNKERFLLMFAPISRTFEKSYDQCGSLLPIPDFKYNQITLPTSLEENMAFLKQWQKLFTGDSFVYDYHLGRAHYGDLGYVSISHILHKDITAIKDIGLNGYISCQELRSFLPNGLPNYVMGHTLMNTSLTFESIVSDYYSHAYGTEWRAVYDYLDTLSKNFSCDYFNGIGPRKNQSMTIRMEHAIECIHDFAPIIKDNLEINSGLKKNFWLHLDYHSQYSILMSRAILELSQEHNETAQNYFKQLVNLIRRNEMKFQTSFDVYRVIEVATKYTGFDLNQLEDK